MSWTKQQAQALAKQILSYSKAPECEVTLGLRRSSHTRFAANEVTTAGSALDLTITVTSRGERKSGTVSVNDTDPEALKQAVARSEELMAIAPPDPEFVEALGPQKYPEIKAAYHEPTARAGAAQRRDGVKAALETGRARKLDTSGFFENEVSWSAIANKKGLFGFHRATGASFSTTMRTDDATGSGWAGVDSPRIPDLKPAEMVERASKKAESSRGPRDLEPGKYTVILEPRAVADLLFGIGMSLSARGADEGRSFFAKPGGGNLVGEKVFHESITLATDPFDARIPSRPWAGGGGRGFLGFGGFGGGGTIWGMPAEKVTWVEKGVLKALSVDRYWAVKTGRQPLPFTGGLVMEGGKGSADDLVAGCDRGLLVTRFWYIRVVNPQTIQLTGLTRDGVWLVEKGKIAGPVNNFRFNESPANLFKNVEALSAAVSTGSEVVPAVRAKDFNFSSKSDAV